MITGGCGFLGGALAGRVRVAGHHVLTLDRDTAADLVCDMGDPVAVAAAVTAARPDAVVHLAAALTDAAAADAVAATRVNALGTAALFAACLAGGVGRVIYASSVAAVGPCAPGSGDEVGLAPQSIYGATKAFGEHLARGMAGGATAFIALRFGWVYGPGRVRGWRVAQDLVERFARGDSPIDYPDMPAMDWTYVDDAAEVLLRSLDGNAVGFAGYNVVGDLRPVADAVAHLRRRFPRIEARPVAVDSPPSGWGMRNDALHTAIGFVPGIRLEEGIDRLLAART